MMADNTLLCVGEYDTLVSNIFIANQNTFVLGNDNTNYYVGSGNIDYASISNYYAIQLNGSAADNTVSNIAGVFPIYRLTPTGSYLIAKVCTSIPLNLGDGFSIVGIGTL
jgi:hypothetical protein